MKAREKLGSRGNPAAKVVITGLSIGPVVGGGTLTGVQYGLLGVAAHTNLTGLNLGGLGLGAGGNVSGISLGGLGMGAGGNVSGINVGGLGIGAGGNLTGINLGGLGAGAGGNISGLSFGGLGLGASGDISGVTVAGLGAGVVIARSPALYRAIQLAGGCYLLWLGLRSAARAVGHHPLPASDVILASERPGLLHHAWREGVSVNLLNPAIVTFYLAVVPYFAWYISQRCPRQPSSSDPARQ